MFIGHYAVGFALKRAEPRLSLGLLMLAAALTDLLFGALYFAGLEDFRLLEESPLVVPYDFFNYPFSHGAAGTLLWALLGGLIYWAWPSAERRSRRRPALILALAIFSHYALDVIAHAPDMPLWGNSSAKLGLSLWRSLSGTMAVELGGLAVGLLLCLRTPPPFSRAGRFALALYAGLLTAIYLANLFIAPSGDMDLTALKVSAGQVPLIALAFWVDTLRRKGQIPFSP